MSYLEMITKQSPWLLDYTQIKQDPQLVRLQHYPLIYHEETFLSYHFEDGVYVVTGARQIGKSTHLKMFIEKTMQQAIKENFLYFNCDLLDRKQDIVDVVETYLVHFPSTKRRYLFLDEMTAVKDSFLAIKYLIDNGHDKNLTYVLTGSNTVNIKKTGEYLPGRRGKGIDFHFKPISFKSFTQLLYPGSNLSMNPQSLEMDFIQLKKQINVQADFKVYLRTGGFPRVINEYYLNKAIDPDIYTIYRSWITSEIAKADKKEYIAKRVLERCIRSLSSDVSYHAFVEDAGVGSHNTIYDYIDFFIDAHVLSQINNIDFHQKRVNYRKNKKIYFNDLFIYATIDAWLTGKPSQDYSYFNDACLTSQLIENLVFLKLANDYHEVFYYKDRHEIDFVTDDSMVEVKYQNKIVPDDYKFMARQTNYKKILVTKNSLKINHDVLMVPIECFLLL